MESSKSIIIKYLPPMSFAAFAALATLCLSLSSGCSDAPTGLNSQSQRTWSSLWIPLVPGNSWVYKSIEEFSQAEGDYTQTLNHGGSDPDRVKLWSDTQDVFLEAGTNTTFSFMDSERDMGLDICYMDNELGRGLAIGGRPESAIGDPREYIGLIELEAGQAQRSFGPAPLDNGSTLEIQVEPVTQIIQTAVGDLEVLRFDCIYRNAEGQTSFVITRWVSKAVGIARIQRSIYINGELVEIWNYELQSYSIF